MMRRIGTAGLGYGQIFLLIFGFLITSALIFLFGIWVGRDVAERRLVQEERIVRAPIQPPPTPDEEAKQQVDQDFYEQLKQKAYVRMQQTAAAAAAPSPQRSAAAGGGPTPALEAAMAGAPLPTPALGTAAGVAPLPTPALAMSPAVARAASPPRASSPRPAAPTRTAVAVAVKPTPKPTPPPRVAPPEAGEERAATGWTVQVIATTNIEQAVELARRLKAKGYDAYTVQAPLRGQTWYRVRVGRYTSRDKAKEMESRLKENEELDNAYVAPQ
jgi:cell division septation protein DedD